MSVRVYATVLGARMREPRRFLQVVTGARQVGKTTLVRQVLSEWGDRARIAAPSQLPSTVALSPSELASDTGALPSPPSLHASA